MTFLVNKKMHPALAARIEASVTGSKAVRGRPKPRTVAIVRVAVFVAMALFLYSVLTISSSQMTRAPRRENVSTSAAPVPRTSSR